MSRLDDVRGLILPAVEPVVETLRLDNQCVAFPMTSAVTEPLPDLVINMGPPIERDNPRFVDHLHLDDDMVRGLQNLEVVVVGIRNHGHRHRPGDAPLPTVPVEPRVTLAAPRARVLAVDQTLLRRRKKLRNPAIGRVDHKGGTLEVSSPLAPSGPRGEGLIYHLLRQGALFDLGLGPSFERCARGVVPHALQVRVSPRGPSEAGHPGSGSSNPPM